MSRLCERRDVSLDNECKLITVEYDEDENGNPVLKKETVQILFCAEIPVPSQEFFRAGQAGIKVSKALVVNTSEYGGETIAEYEGKRYSIYRTYPGFDGNCELYLEQRIGLSE